MWPRASPTTRSATWRRRSAGASERIEATYRAPVARARGARTDQLHGAVQDGRAEVWAPTQVPGLARSAAAKALGIEPERVEVHVTLLGGGFGRRLEVDFFGQAAAIAREADGAPVQTFWSRAEDTRHDFIPAGLRPRASPRASMRRSASSRGARVGGAVDRAGGARAGLRAARRRAGQDHVRGRVRPALRVAGGSDRARGGVAAVADRFWRAVGHSHHAFFKEGFVDECAHAAKADPVAFRLRAAAAPPAPRGGAEARRGQGGWGTPPRGRARRREGRARRALHQSFARSSRRSPRCRSRPATRARSACNRVVCAIDCGTPVNPNLIAQQMESCIVSGCRRRSSARPRSPRAASRRATSTTSRRCGSTPARASRRTSCPRPGTPRASASPPAADRARGRQRAVRAHRAAPAQPAPEDRLRP